MHYKPIKFVCKLLHKMAEIVAKQQNYYNFLETFAEVNNNFNYWIVDGNIEVPQNMLNILRDHSIEQSLQIEYAVMGLKSN